MPSGAEPGDDAELGIVGANADAECAGGVDVPEFTCPVGWERDVVSASIATMPSATR